MLYYYMINFDVYNKSGLMVSLLPKVLWCIRESQALTVIQMAVLNKYFLKPIYLIHLALYSFVFLVKTHK